MEHPEDIWLLILAHLDTNFRVVSQAARALFAKHAAKYNAYQVTYTASLPHVLTVFPNITHVVASIFSNTVLPNIKILEVHNFSFGLTRDYLWPATLRELRLTTLTNFTVACEFFLSLQTSQIKKLTIKTAKPLPRIFASTIIFHSDIQTIYYYDKTDLTKIIRHLANARFN